MTFHSAILAAGLCVGAAATSSAATFDFESGLPPEFSGAGAITAVGGLSGLNGFSGSFLWTTAGSGDASDFAVTGLAAHDTVTLTFSLALIDSWDALDGAPSPDYFNILADGVEVFEISVASASGTTELIPAGATNRNEPGSVIGNTSWNDILFDVSVSFAHTGDALDLSMFADGAGWQGGLDESWGIDNLDIQTSTTVVSAVPLPAGAVLLLSGFGLLALRRN